MICVKDNEKIVIAKGGRYDELVEFFNPKESSANGLGFSISVDNLRNLIKEENNIKNKILILIKDKELLSKAILEQKKLHDAGIISILETNPILNKDVAKNLMEENKCTDIYWVD